MDFSFSYLNFNSVENLSGFEARVAFTVNSASVFREDVDIVPTVVDDTLSYIPWGGDNQMPYDLYWLDETAVFMSFIHIQKFIQSKKIQFIFLCIMFSLDGLIAYNKLK